MASGFSVTASFFSIFGRPFPFCFLQSKNKQKKHTPKKEEARGTGANERRFSLLMKRGKKNWAAETGTAAIDQLISRDGSVGQFIVAGDIVVHGGRRTTTRKVERKMTSTSSIDNSLIDDTSTETTWPKNGRRKNNNHQQKKK